jgi:Bacteriophage Lambda NinG protein
MAAKKEEAERTKARKAALKRIPDLIKEAQIAFNAYVRLRDKAQPCICCGKPLVESSVGGGFDAGHYRSTGSASHLRFNEDNCHAQRKVCNRYGAGRAVDYRIGLINRIGLERVEALENNNTPHKWDRDELIEIKELYRKKLKELECKQ